MNRLLPIEGLRAYLAIWVIIGHVMSFSGLDPHATYSSPLRTLAAEFFGDGLYAVELFMMISGFVIFFLLDKKRENYGQFLVRRFFRLYPLYIVLLLIGICFSSQRAWTVAHSQAFMSAGNIHYYLEIFDNASAHWIWNFLLHLGMLQGSIPNTWLGSTSAYSFLVAAWSISVEWQFYLLAPCLYLLAIAEKPIYRVILCGCIFALYLAMVHGFWPLSDAFIFFYIAFFFIGIASYFIYKALPSFAPDAVFLISLGLALFIYFIGMRQGGLIPIVIWIPFLGLICEGSSSIAATLLLGFFNNRIVQYLGAISYGLYLSHELVMTGMQYLLIMFAPAQDQATHFSLLLLLTFLGTVCVASILHRLIELPGMALGKKLASQLKPSTTVPTGSLSN